MSDDILKQASDDLQRANTQTFADDLRDVVHKHKRVTPSMLIALYAERLVRDADVNLHARGRADMRDAVLKEIRRTLAFYEEPGRITREERGMVSGVLRGLIVNIEKRMP